MIEKIINIKIKKLDLISKILDDHKIHNSIESDEDTDREDNDFISYLFDTKEKIHINIIEIYEDLSNSQKFKRYSSNITKKLNSNILDNPEFILYNNYIIHIRFSIINNRNYIILFIDKIDYEYLRYKSTKIIQKFIKFKKFLFNPILFQIDFDIFSKEKFINNIITLGKTMNIIKYEIEFNENIYNYNDGLFNYFIKNNKSNNTINYYYYRIDKFILN